MGKYRWQGNWGNWATTGWPAFQTWLNALTLGPWDVDNDLDGLLDCLDPDCFGLVECGTCGNGLVDPGEECDDATANSDSLVDACRTTCQRAGCGDGAGPDRPSHGHL